MPESEAHKRAKKQAVGKKGKTEVPLKGGERLDATTKKKAVEVEYSGDFNGAAQRLKKSRKPQKVMIVKKKDIPQAVQTMKNADVGGTVRTKDGRSRRSVPKKKK
ncbi:MAG: hypothetical protein E3J71_09355 [Candidatus Stahlbacteria bacterium]|nr:MAG: hypothetical protein E3J71_09355 [Candidatus Stahlbacteria bacterium]